MICNLPDTLPSDPLLPFEQLALQSVIRRLSIRNAPAAALLPDADNDKWHATFKSAVIDQARERGLVRDRFLGRGVRCTESGTATTSRWLGVRTALLTASQPLQLLDAGTVLNDRMFAWAVALDAAPEGLIEMLAPDLRVWSSAGGTWRQVRVSESEQGTLWWGRSPESAAQDRTITGQIVRRWITQKFISIDAGYDAIHHLAIDDGHSEEALVWRVPERMYERSAFGSTVIATIDHKGRLVGIADAVSP